MAEESPQPKEDPSWSEIMAEVWKRREKTRKRRPNPVLEERKRRNYGLRLRLGDKG